MNLGVASRFALLKIDDDDEEDGDGIVRGQPSSKNKKPAHHGKTKFVPFGSSSVNNATSQKQQKKKNGKKHKPVEFDSGAKGFDENESDDERQLQEVLRMSERTAVEEQMRRREIEAEEEEGTQQAIEESTKSQGIDGAVAGSKGQTKPPNAKNKTTGTTSPPPSFGDREDDHEIGDSDIDLIIKATKDEAKHLIDSAKRQRHAYDTVQNALYELYKRQFEQLAILAKSQEKELMKSKIDLAKTKKRAKMFCEVFSEAEMHEKAELIVSRDKTAEVNQELTRQLGDMHKELEQARSRIHELENVQKKAKAAR